MVKGISRRVVVVKSPDGGIFEEAIFIVKDEGAGREDILREACRVADQYIKTGSTACRESPHQLIAAGTLGAVLTGICWIIASCFGF